MKDLPFVKVVTILLPAVFGMILLAAGSVSHSTFDSGVGVVLLITGLCFFPVWFAPR
jgi:hypothetical protein